ncbi:hypothetical protein AAKU55_005279 [Oxalobacteraceae bacterium GrIS 1.11]
MNVNHVRQMSIPATVHALTKAIYRTASHSPEFMAGEHSILKGHMHHRAFPCPFAMGTAQADAFFAGAEEGRRVWSDIVAAENS